MREKSPFRFDLTKILQRARREAARRTDGASVTLSLPFFSVTTNLTDVGRRAAREIVIRMADRRVLSAKECCDNCIDNALESLQSIRSILVDKQVELSHLTDGPLYFLIEAMLEGVRQFLTYEQRLTRSSEDMESGDHPDFRRPRDQREAYFAALEVLRGHLNRCLGQVASIADVALPSVGMIADYQNARPLEAYVKPEPKQLT